MDIQAVIVGIIVLAAAAYLVWKYRRTAKGRGGCGCDGGGGCPAEKRIRCGSGK